MDAPPGDPCIGGGGAPDDTWVPWITDEKYSTRRTSNETGEPGKVFGFAAWRAPQGI